MGRGAEEDRRLPGFSKDNQSSGSKSEGKGNGKIY